MRRTHYSLDIISKIVHILCDSDSCRLLDVFCVISIAKLFIHFTFIFVSASLQKTFTNEWVSVQIRQIRSQGVGYRLHLQSSCSATTCVYVWMNEFKFILFIYLLINQVSIILSYLPCLVAVKGLKLIRWANIRMRGNLLAIAARVCVTSQCRLCMPLATYSLQHVLIAFTFICSAGTCSTFNCILKSNKVMCAALYYYKFSSYLSEWVWAVVQRACIVIGWYVVRSSAYRQWTTLLFHRFRFTSNLFVFVCVSECCM